MIDLTSFIQPIVGVVTAVGALIVGVFIAHWRGKVQGESKAKKEMEHEAFKERERRAQTRQNVEQRVRDDDGDHADSLRERWSRD